MSIIQISKIQQRSGNLVDLPQLDEAQFGWASDAKRLFIGKTTPNENIEVLTSYSNISFSQIDGSDGGNFNIANATNGQVLTYVDTTNTWENWPSTTILTANANFKLDLGDVGNIKMDGGATGYILETDGVGNVAWTSKGTLRTVITALSNATPVIMTVANTTPYTNGLPVTISGANAANANTIVNGQTFYVKVAVDFPTSGNAELYTTQDLANANAVVGTNLGTYTANSGIATALISGSGISNAGGSVNTIQFNNSGVLNGSANFTITSGNLVTLTGNFSASNIAGGNLVTANFITGRLTTAAQPNITSTGTLAGLVVAGNITPSANITYNLGNNTNRFNDLYLSNSTIYIGAQTISANTSSVIVSGNLVANMIGNVSGNATTAGTVITAAQPNITSTGTLVSLSVSGNANIGNIGTAGLITATGNIGGGNINTGGLITATGNITGANIITGGLITATGNITGANIITGGLITATGNANVGNLGTGGLITATGNITGANIITGGLITATGNLNAGNIITAGVVSATGNGTFGNVSVTGIFASTLSATANANVGNLGTAGLIVATGNITGGNLTTSGVVSATLYVGSGANLTNIAGANVSGEVTFATTANAVAGANVSGTVTQATTVMGATQNNITTLGALTTLSTGANTTLGNITGNWQLTTGSRLNATYADLAEYYEADAQFEPGTVLEFGGDKEVTLAQDGTARVAGVVSTDPAYAMNTNCPGIAVAIALQGRVPTKVRGTVRKGDMMVSAGNGYARPWNNPQMGTVIGKALENFDGIEGVIEVAVGRL